MSTPLITLAATAAIAGISFVAVTPTAKNIVNPTGPFVEIQSLTYDAGQVILKRQVNEDKEVLTRVTVVPDFGVGRPICNGFTTSQFTKGESAEKVFSVDAFTVDPGCANRLAETPGTYVVFASYTPFDGTAPVVARMVMEID